MSQRKILVISGPTATGKTSTSIHLAKKFNGEIINFDSLVFYKEISIGTAKPTPDEMGAIPHHLVGSHSVKNHLNAADFQKLAIPLINSVLEKGKLPILVGGSGFYIQTVLKGMYSADTPDPEIIKISDDLYDEEGIDPFIKILNDNDKVSAERLHENDHYRIRRAVEYFWSTGKKFSDARDEMKEKLKHTPPMEHGWDVLHIYLDIPKPQHWEIIEKRTHQIFTDGILEEIKGLLDQGYSKDYKPLQSIGYKQAIQYLEGEFENLEDCIERTIIATRQLAKAQRTWFAKVDKHSYNPLEELTKIEHDVSEFLG